MTLLSDQMTSLWSYGDVMMTSCWKLPGRGCKCPSKQFRHHQGTCNLQHMNLENHMFHDKGISLLSSLSSHNLEKTFQKCKNIVNKFLGEYFVRFRACKNFGQAKIDKFLSVFENKQSTTSCFIESNIVFSQKL